MNTAEWKAQKRESDILRGRRYKKVSLFYQWLEQQLDRYRHGDAGGRYPGKSPDIHQKMFFITTEHLTEADEESMREDVLTDMEEHPPEEWIYVELSAGVDGWRYYWERKPKEE
jgi:hypothetical protein